MKRLLVLLVMILVAGSLAAFDFGGYLDNTTGLRNAPVGAPNAVQLIQSTTLALWVNQPLGAWTLDAQGSYTFTPTIPLLFDLDRLTLGTDVIASEAGATTFGFTIGRSTFTDPTGSILNHTLDGLRLQVNRTRSSFRFGAGTTALLQKPTNQIILSTPDILDLSEPSVRFAPPRLIAQFEYRALEAFAGQHLTLAALMQEDLRPTDELTPVGSEIEDPTAGGRVDTQYATLALSGPLGPGIFHRLYYTLNSGRRLEYVESEKSGTGSWYQYEEILAHMAGAELTWFLPQTLNSRARLFGLYSTDAFVPLSPSSYSDVFTLQPGNSAHIGVSYSLRPLAGLGSDVLQTELKSVSYFRSAGGGYVGTDFNVIVTAVPLSDVRLVLTGGAFVPEPAMMSPQDEGIDYQVTLQGVVRF